MIYFQLNNKELVSFADRIYCPIFYYVNLIFLQTVEYLILLKNIKFNLFELFKPINKIIYLLYFLISLKFYSYFLNRFN